MNLTSHTYFTFPSHFIFITLHLSVRIIEQTDVLSLPGFHSHNIPRPLRNALLSVYLYVTTQSLSTPPSAFPLSLETPEGPGSYHLAHYSSFSLHLVKLQEEAERSE